MSDQAAPLAGLRVLEITAPAAVAGGRTLAELGAEVIRIDAAGSAGDPARRPAPRTSPAWTGLPGARRPVTLDSRFAPGRQALAELLAISGLRGGIVLTSAAGRAWASHAELARNRPDVIHLQAGHHPNRTVGRNDTAAGSRPGTGPERPSSGRNRLLPAWDVAYGLHAAAGLLAACRHRQHTGRGRAIKLTPEGVARALPGHLGHLAQAQLTRVHQVRIGDARYGGFAGDFATADDKRVAVAILASRHFTDLAKTTRLTRTFTFLERLLGADFSACGDLYTHRETIAALLASWFARHTVAGLAAAFAATAVPWQPLPIPASDTPAARRAPHIIRSCSRVKNSWPGDGRGVDANS
jgi:2-methylfumaryl-CoA isomerase